MESLIYMVLCCRKFFLSVLDHLAISNHCLKLFFVLPIMVSYGCVSGLQHEFLHDSPDISTTIAQGVVSAKSSYTALETLDVMIYNNDPLGRIDSFQHFENITEDVVDVASMTGEKSVYLIGNYFSEPVDISHLPSKAAISSLSASFLDETFEKPCVVAHCDDILKADNSLSVSMEPLSAEVCLQSIRCDFSKTPYAGEKLKNIRVYLINAVASALLFPQDRRLPVEYLNRSCLSDEDMLRMADPSLLLRELSEAGDISSSPRICLRCFPNNSTEDGLGSPFTRLVIEGDIQGNRYYYAIDVFKDGCGPQSACRYIYDITITRKGTTEPDNPLRLEDAEVRMEVSSWKEIRDTVFF